MAQGPFSLEGRVAIVTGASRGIGEAIAVRLAEAGAAVALAARKPEGLEAVARRIGAAGGRALAVPAHMGKRSDVEALVAKTVEAFGKVDVLVNNAAANPYFGPLLGIEEGAWDKTFEVNLKGLASCKSCHGADLTGATGPSCATCHTAAGYAAWDTNCTFCHGSTVTGRQNPPVDIQGRTATTNVSVGVHEAHATTTIAVVACIQCHPARTASVVTDAAHIDGIGIAEVQLGALAKTGGALATYTRTSATSASCASTYCHGKFTGGTSATVSWTGTTQVSCSSCHPATPTSGDHSKHTSRFGCYVCHNAVLNSSKAIIDKTLHVNGVDNVKFGGTYNSRTVTGTWNASTRTCSSLSCHGSETW
jgi:predicted CxxxxCH...CXXCH cytochrome family protein